MDSINHRAHVSFDALPTMTEHPARVEIVRRCIAEARRKVSRSPVAKSSSDSCMHPGAHTETGVRKLVEEAHRAIRLLPLPEMLRGAGTSG